MIGANLGYRKRRIETQKQKIRFSRRRLRRSTRRGGTKSGRASLEEAQDQDSNAKTDLAEDDSDEAFAAEETKVDEPPSKKRRTKTQMQPEID